MVPQWFCLEARELSRAPVEDIVSLNAGVLVLISNVLEVLKCMILNVLEEFLR